MKEPIDHIIRLIAREIGECFDIDLEHGQPLDASQYHCCIDNFQTSLQALLLQAPKTEKRKGSFYYFRSTGEIGHLHKANNNFYTLTIHSTNGTMPTIDWRYKTA